MPGDSKATGTHCPSGNCAMTQEHINVYTMSESTTSKLVLQLDTSSGKHMNWAQRKDGTETQLMPHAFEEDLSAGLEL